MKHVRWGMIGCGRVTETKSAPGLYKTKNSSLLAVMSRSYQNAKDYASRHNVQKVYADSDDLFNDSEIDAVYIATPPSSHKDYTLAAAKAGKAIYLEKPMAQDYAECEEMLAACQDVGVPLFVAYYRRALPKFIKIKELINSGILGDIRFVSMTFTKPTLQIDIEGTYHWHIDPTVSKYGQITNTVSHMIDTVQFFLGNIASVKAIASQQAGFYEPPDSVSAVMVFESGVHGIANWNFSVGQGQDRTEIIGSEGKITYATYFDEPVIIETKTEDKTLDLPFPEHVQQPMIQTIVDELTGRGECLSTGETAATTNYWIDRIMLDASIDG